MRCHLPLDDEGPFPDDDPFLPRQDAPTGLCQKCGQTHRLDLGCPVLTRGELFVVGLVLLVGIAAIWRACS